MNSTRNVLEANADPDYDNVQEESLGEINESLHREDARDQAIQKIQKIIREQFSFEIDLKQKEVTSINHRVNECRTNLDRLRACILAGYYGYGTSPGNVQQGGCRIGKTKMPKSCLKEASLHDIMNWKRSLPPSLKEQLSDENLSSRSETSENLAGVSSRQGTNCSPCKFRDIESPNMFRPASSNPTHENESRFYVKRRIIVGNTSKYILPEQRELNDRSTHKWMVYVRGPKDDSELQHFISKVWFLLHPSYQPNDLVEVCKPPFQVTRRGWGEFPVRVQLHFVKNKNKRVDIIHHLKLDKTYTGLQTLGAETHVDIELDRKNFDGLQSCKQLLEDKSNEKTTPCLQGESTAPVSSHCFDLASCSRLGQNEVDCGSLEIDQKGLKLDKYGFTSEGGILGDHSYSSVVTEDKPSCQDDMKYSTPPSSIPDSRCSTPKSSGKCLQSLSIEQDVEQESDILLQKVIGQFPIVRPKESLNKPGYCASSLEQFLGWNTGKRLAAEWQRAFALRGHVNKQRESSALSTKRVMNYCRFHGYTPMVDVSSEEKTICKFCGEENESDDDDDDDDDGENDKPVFSHEECASEFDEENDVPEIHTTAEEFLEILTKSECASAKHSERQEEDEDVDVVGVTHEQSTNDSSNSRLCFLPITAEQNWVQEIAAEVHVSLTNSNIDGVHAPVTSAMLYKACLLFLQDIVRKANRFTWKSTLNIPRAKCILPLHVKKALEVIPHCDFLTNKYLKVELDSSEDS